MMNALQCLVIWPKPLAQQRLAGALQATGGRRRGPSAGRPGGIESAAGWPPGPIPDEVTLLRAHHSFYRVHNSATEFRFARNPAALPGNLEPVQRGLTLLDGDENSQSGNVERHRLRFANVTQ